jgi:hypothetical protein
LITVIGGLPDGIFGLALSGVVDENDLGEAMESFAETIRKRYELGQLLEIAIDTSLADESDGFLFDIRLQFRGPAQRLAMTAVPQWQQRLSDLAAFLRCEGRRFPQGSVSKLLTG